MNKYITSTPVQVPSLNRSRGGGYMLNIGQYRWIHALKKTFFLLILQRSGYVRYYPRFNHL